MALRDHSLDKKIENAAFAEFMGNGYANASLRKIADVAGVTIGAIRTRFRTKEDLFSDCISPLLSEIQNLFSEIQSVFVREIENSDNPLNRLKQSIQYETDAILKVLFAHYEEAVLLFCRSGGSRYAHFLRKLIDDKTEVSVSFLQKYMGISVDKQVFRLLVSLQYQSYKQIIQSGCSREDAKKYTDILVAYHYGGWCSLFDAKLS